MDDRPVLNITIDGSPMQDGSMPTPTFRKIDLLGSTQRQITQQEIEKRKQDRTIKQGQFAWAKLHSYTGNDPQWLDLWQYFIPARCDCKDGYQKILEEMPPDFTSPDAFFAWSVRLHNAVNKKLGKPELTIDEARKIWRRNDGCSENSGSNLP